MELERPRRWLLHSRQSMNDPPTALVGFETGLRRAPFCRLSMNDPPTALVGFETGLRPAPFCRLSMNNPPTALVGFGRENVQTPGSLLRSDVVTGHRGAIERSLLRSGVGTGH